MKKHCAANGEVTEWTIVHAWNAWNDRNSTSRNHKKTGAPNVWRGAVEP